MKISLKYSPYSLREKAEELLENKKSNSALPQSESELRSLVHELEVQKLELEIQNEELILTEEALRRSEEQLISLNNQLETAQKIGQSGSWTYDMATQKIRGSAEARNLFGLGENDSIFTLENIEACIPDRERVRKALFDLINENKVYDLEYLMYPADGSQPKTIVSKASLVKDSEGNTVSVIGSLLDITERKEVERELRSKSAILINLLINLHEGILLENAERKIVLTNQLFCDMFAIPAPPAALTGADCTESAEQSKHLFANPEKFVTDISRILANQKPIYGDELKLADGRYFERDYIPTFQNNEYSGHLWKYRDITERKHALHKVEESDARFSQVVAQSHEVVWEVDASGLYTYVSPMSVQVYGYSAEELVGKLHFYDLAPEVSRLGLKNMAMYLFKQKINFENLINSVCKPNGEIITVSTNGIPILNEKGDLIGYRGIDADISDRLKAEKEIISSEEKFRSIAEQTTDLIAIADENGFITFASPSSSSVFLISPSDMCGRNFSDFIDESETENAMKVFSTCMEKGGKIKAAEFRMKRTDGSIFIGELNGSNFITELQKGILVTIRDITERKRAEQEIHDLNANLEQKITIKTAELAGTNENLKKEIDERVKASSALMEALDRLNKIADRIPGFVFQYQLNPDGTSCFPFASKGIQEIYRVSPEDVSDDATLVFSNLHSEDYADVVESIRESAQNLSLWHHEYRVKYEDGTVNWLLGNALPQRLANGTVLWHGFISDITTTKQAEEEIKQISSRLALATQSSGVGVWDFDIVNNILLWDDQMYVLFGISKEDFKGSYEAWQAGLHPDDKARCDAETMMAIHGEKEFDTEYRIIWPDGSIHFIRAFAIVNRDEKGNPLHMIGTNWDITAQKLAEAALAVEKQRLASIIEGTNVGTWEWNIQTGETIFNERWAEILGYSLDEISPVSIETWMKYAHPEDLKISGELLEKHFRKEIDYYSIESRMKHKTGKWVWVLDRGKVHKWDNEGKPLLMSGTHQEITERKLVEEEIIKARIEAEEANMAKSEFLSRMSHELRTPMNSILGFAQLIEMGEIIPVHRKGINHILKSGKHLLHLINEILDISKIEAGRISLSMEPVNLHNAIMEMIDIVQPQTEFKKVSVELVESPTNHLSVIADNQRFKQVILNLINNAIKYNRKGGTVHIKTEVRSSNSKAKPVIRISVADTGTGIKPEEISKLFQPFERIGAEHTDTEGTGLGLMVVKKLIDAMEGSIGVESTPGKGSIFWIELTQSKQKKNKQMKGSESTLYSQSIAPKFFGTILYIEDNASNIELLEQIIAARRPDIRLISNPKGGNALQLALEYLPDIILLDLNLPDIHGSKVLENLKDNEITNSIPVVVISADAMPHQVEKLLSTGAIKYLTKPLHVLDYLKVIDEYTGR